MLQFSISSLSDRACIIWSTGRSQDRDLSCGYTLLGVSASRGYTVRVMTFEEVVSVTQFYSGDLSATRGAIPLQNHKSDAMPAFRYQSLGYDQSTSHDAPGKIQDRSPCRGTHRPPLNHIADQACPRSITNNDRQHSTSQPLTHLSTTRQP